MKIDKTVKQETLYIAGVELLLSVLMEAVFLILHRWNLQVLAGNLLGYVTAVGNFFLMGLTVQHAVVKEEKDAKQLMRLSQSLRNMGIMVILILGFALPLFDAVAVVASILFPRIAIALRPIINKGGEHA